MASQKVFAVLLLATIVSVAFARPGHGGYYGYSSPISYGSYHFPSYSHYPSYKYGHGLYSSYSYPLYGYGHDYGYGGWLGSYW